MAKSQPINGASCPTPLPPHQHWVEKLANQVIEKHSPPYTVTAGMTTSGPFHMGTLSEFLYPSAMARFLEQRGGVKFIFSADILDAFDSIPSSMAQHAKLLSDYLGRPLCDVPDPDGCCKSFGEHYLGESMLLAEKFGIRPEIRKASDDYRRGVYDAHAKRFIQNLALVREVIAATSLNPNFPTNWFPVMPQCSNCGRIATTEITSISNDRYSYSCTRNVEYAKGCGFVGEHRLSDHKYKLQWRLHWPSWMDINHTHIEGAGMDHHTRGGSWDSLVGVFKEIFKKAPPITYKWGFVLLGGKKYSKSKGVGMGVTDLIKLVPSEVLAYALIKPDLEESRDINPTGENLLRLLDDFQGAAAIDASLCEGAIPIEGEGAVSRADRKRALAFRLASQGRIWKAQFSDLLVYHVLYRNWDVVAEKLGNPGDVAMLSGFVEAWEKSGMVPPQYNFKFAPSMPKSEAAREFFTALSPNHSPLEIHNLAFNTAKAHDLQAGAFFIELYQTMIGQPSGPKLGKLVEAIGVEKVKTSVLGG